MHCKLEFEVKSVAMDRVASIDVEEGVLSASAWLRLVLRLMHDAGAGWPF